MAKDREARGPSPADGASPAVNAITASTAGLGRINAERPARPASAPRDPVTTTALRPGRRPADGSCTAAGPPSRGRSAVAPGVPICLASAARAPAVAAPSCWHRRARRRRTRGPRRPPFRARAEARSSRPPTRRASRRCRRPETRAGSTAQERRSHQFSIVRAPTRRDHWDCRRTPLTACQATCLVESILALAMPRLTRWVGTAIGHWRGRRVLP